MLVQDQVIDRSFLPTRAFDIRASDVILFRSPLFHIKTVKKAGWCYSESLDKDYWKITFHDGSEYASDDEEETLFASHETAL